MRSEWLYGQLSGTVANYTGRPQQPKSGQTSAAQQNQSFAKLFQAKLEENPNQNQSQIEFGKQPLQFSKHAEERLRMRSIQFSSDQMQRIEKGVEQIAQKGGKDSLVICGNVSLVVNIPKRTVITAMDTNGSSNHVFTQIDSAVIV